MEEHGEDDDDDDEEEEREDDDGDVGHDLDAAVAHLHHLQANIKLEVYSWYTSSGKSIPSN